MKFIHIWTELCRPCPILPTVHKKICDIVTAHATGAAHGKDGIAGMYGEPENAEDQGKLRMDGNVAVIPINGVIGKHVGSLERMSGATDVDDITGQVQKAIADEAVAGILLDVNSPGGSVSGVPEASDIIAEAAKMKPVVAYTDQLMASAAMWLAAGAGAIYASKSAHVGSIGVYMAFLDSSRAYELAGLKMELIKAGTFKGMGMAGTSLSDDERALLQSEVDKVYCWFTDHVTEYRNVPSSAMQGQTFYGSDAVGVGLIDRVGGYGDAMAEVKSMISRKIRHGGSRS